LLKKGKQSLKERQYSWRATLDCNSEKISCAKLAWRIYSSGKPPHSKARS
jgi:hypothetical protein